MKQSKTMSVVESMTNIAVGMGISIVAQIIMLAWWDVHLKMSQNVIMTVIFTVISFARSFILRRVFEYIRYSQEEAADV